MDVLQRMYLYFKSVIQIQMSVRLQAMFFGGSIFCFTTFLAFFNPELSGHISYVAESYWLTHLRHGNTAFSLAAVFLQRPSWNGTVVQIIFKLITFFLKLFKNNFQRCGRETEARCFKVFFFLLLKN